MKITDINMPNTAQSAELEAELDETEHEPLSAEELAELEAETARWAADIQADFEALKRGITFDDEDDF